jgi:hypothetical protein
MKHQLHLRWMIPVIGLLAAFAAAAGLFWPGEGTPYPLISYRGEPVVINARGLYVWDTVSSAAQMQANDLVTLLIGLPLLASASWLAFRGALRGHLVLTGTLGYVLYTYLSMAMLAAFNVLFLVYVALFSLSLIAFVLALLAFDLDTLPQRFSTALPRRAIAGLLTATGLFLLIAWAGRIAAPWLNNTPPALENTTTMVIQAMDLGLVVPLALIAAWQLWRRTAWGYLLASVAVTKMLTMGAAVSLMGFNMARNGAADSPILVGVFMTITAVNVILAVLLLLSAEGQRATRQATPVRG